MRLVLLAAALLSGCTVYPGAYVTSTTQRGYQESKAAAGLDIDLDGAPVGVSVYGGMSKEGDARTEPYAEVSAWWKGNGKHFGAKR